MQSIYLDLTDEFNAGRLRAIICSGQAVVLHKLAIMSKDGDWIVREDEEALGHLLATLAARGARYRFGAPLDIRWMKGGWSAHLEFQEQFRVRTDFFTRPPRLSQATLANIWREQAFRSPPVLDPTNLVEMKKTNREKDYVVIGELARLIESPQDKLLCSRSPRDLLALNATHPDLAARLSDRRPLLAELNRGEDQIARLLDEERRHLIRKNEERLQRHTKAAGAWSALWPEVNRRISGMPLREAHAFMIEAAINVLPFGVGENVHD
jgi:hypothetical protein